VHFAGGYWESRLVYTGRSSAHALSMRTFRPYDLDQPYLLPPDLRSWLSEGHLALFVSDVVDALDLSPIFDAYERGDGRGYPPYHPVMMVKLLVYGYCTGKVSSEQDREVDLGRRCVPESSRETSSPTTTPSRNFAGVTSRRWQACSCRFSSCARKRAW